MPVTVTGTLPELDLKFESESVPVPGHGTQMRMTLASPLAPPGTVKVVTGSLPSAKWGVHINVKYAINRLLHV